jgi:hypothetical protein
MNPDEHGCVADDQRCPQCLEAHMDQLIWTGDREVTCQHCGTKYDPSRS